MAVEQFANEAQTTLSAAIETVDGTSISVTSASGFPDSAQYRIRIDDEIMLVTAGAGTTTWTVTRGVEGTSGATHENGATVTHVLTAGALEQLKDDTLVTAAKVTARIYRSTDQTIPNTTETAISFDTARWDDRPAGLSAQWSSGDATKLICRVAGTYVIAGGVEFGAHASERRVLLKLNGTTHIAASRELATASFRSRYWVATTYKLSVDDYIELIVYHATGGDNTVFSGSAYSPELCWALIP